MEKTKYDLVVWGKHPVEAALASSFTAVHEVWLDQKADESFVTRVRSKVSGNRLRMSGGDQIQKFCRTEKHQGVAARVSVTAYATLREWHDENGNQASRSLGLALDDLQDPQNVGTLWRAAGFFGAGFVLMTKDRSAPLTGVVAKASAGAVFVVPMIRSVNLARELDDAVDLGFWRLGLAVDAEGTLSKMRPTPGSTLLVLGNEAKGLRPLTAKKCDELVRISGGSDMESLNVAVAGAIALYEVSRTRTA